MELSSKKGTIGKVIKDNLNYINAARSKAELVTLMESALDQSTNKDKENFLSTLRQQRSLQAGMTFLYNYMLKGDGFGTLS